MTKYTTFEHGYKHSTTVSPSSATTCSIQRQDCSGRLDSSKESHSNTTLIALSRRHTAHHNGNHTKYESGFSLLELVVAVSIMLILGVVGTVSYQTYTDNARQAALDTSASEVLTAVIAEDSVPEGEPLEAVESFNATSEEIIVDILTANSNSMTVAAATCDGGTAQATVAGDYTHLDTTNYRDVQYNWVDTPHDSVSTKEICGEIVDTNQAVNPVYENNRWWSANHVRHNTHEAATFTDHPLGITTGLQSTLAQEGYDYGKKYSLSMFNVGRNSIDNNFYMGVWLKTDTPGEAWVGARSEPIPMPTDTWVFVTSDGTVDSVHPTAYIRHDTKDIAMGATSWVTGAMISYDEPVTAYFDGDTR